MGFRRNRRYLVIGMVAVIILAISLFFVFQSKEELNIISSQYITISGKSLNNGDFQVDLEILQPANIQIDEWHSWVQGDLGYRSPTESGTKLGLSIYIVKNVSAQRLSVFLTIGGHETIFNEYFTDTFVNQFTHTVIGEVTEETTIEETVTKEPSPIARFFGATPGFELYLILLIPLIIKRRKKDGKRE